MGIGIGLKIGGLGKEYCFPREANPIVPTAVPHHPMSIREFSTCTPYPTEYIRSNAPDCMRKGCKLKQLIKVDIFFFSLPLRLHLRLAYFQW